DLMRIIQSLPDGYRTVFNLYAIEGYSHKEIAEILEITESTSKSQYSRAKGILRSILEKNGIER
ncbi:MAG: RNA polymerase sigma factor, partial [Crocinitomicaceae bacterium]|nr:RNA polymerase sigma factor [Crocinitomicaceae bacterium]